MTVNRRQSRVSSRRGGGESTRIRSGLTGPLFRWYWEICLPALVIAGTLALSLKSSKLAVAAGIVWIMMLTVGLRTGLFVRSGVLCFRLGGLKLWSVRLVEITCVQASIAPEGKLRVRWIEPWRLEVMCGSRVFALPGDVPSRFWSSDPAASARATAQALSEELRTAGATALVHPD